MGRKFAVRGESDLRSILRMDINSKIRDSNHDISNTQKYVTEWVNTYGDDFRITIQFIIPIALPPGRKAGHCKATIDKVLERLLVISEGYTSRSVDGGWTDGKFLFTEKSILFEAGIRLDLWAEVPEIMSRVIDDIQRDLRQKCVYFTVDNIPFGDPINLLNVSWDRYPDFEQFGEPDPDCLEFLQSGDSNLNDRIDPLDMSELGLKGIFLAPTATGDQGTAFSAENVYITNNYGPISNISKEWVDLIEQIKQIADTNRAKSDKIGELEEELAKLAEENEKLQRKVSEVDNPPPSLLNQMDAANRSLTKLISQFRTPGAIAQIMVRLSKPTGGKIYDGCCGDGDLLLEAHRYAETEQQNEPLQFYGQEFNKYLWNQAKANFAIQGIEVDLGPSHGSTLHNPYHLGLSVDYVISDIPFGMKINPKLDSEDPRWALNGQIGIRDGDVAWILHSLHQLASSGICIIHLPVGILFRSNKETSALRKFLVEENLLSGIVALKPNIIPSTSIQTCILILEKRGSDSVRKSSRGVFMMDCSEYEGIKRQNFYAFSKHEISSIVDAYTDWHDKSATSSVDLPPNCKVVTAEDIIENDYNLMPNRYL